MSTRILAFTRRCALFFGIVAAAFAGAAAAADGDLDPTFGTGGFALAGVTGASFQIPAKPVVMADGRILVCSSIDDGGASGADFFAARFTADGDLDPTFDFDGRVSVDFDSRADVCNAVAVQPDGKVLLVGSSDDDNANNTDFAVARLNADGSLDPTFGAGTGKTLVPFDLGATNTDVADAVALQPDGNILAAGFVDTSANGDDFGIVRLLPDGTRDTTFNGTGRVTIGFDFQASLSKTDQADAVIVLDTGRILVGGIAETNGDAYDFALARLLPSGQLDSNFSADGRATIAFDLGGSGSDISYQTIVQRDGKIVMAGFAETGATNSDMAIARALPDGSLDSGFGVGGKTVVPFDLTTNGADIGLGAVQDDAGRIVIGGVAVYDAMSNVHAAATRLRADGSLDASFGAFGKKTFDFGGVSEYVTGVALQGTQIIAGGLTTTALGGDDFVARLDVDLIFADGFE